MLLKWGLVVVSWSNAGFKAIFTLVSAMPKISSVPWCSLARLEDQVT